MELLGRRLPLVLREHPRIGVAFSVRTSYVEVVIPAGLVPKHLIQVVHSGFAPREFQATARFFDYYGIERPTIPLMVPEFHNPLFLKLFCEGLAHVGMTRIPSGLTGITAILDFYLEALNKKLAHPTAASFNPGSRLVQRAVEDLAQAMAERGVAWLSLDEAQRIVDKTHRRDAYEDSLFAHLLSEGLLARDLFRDQPGHQATEGVRFSYERVTDHLLVRHLLNEHLDSVSPDTSFQRGSTIGQLLRDEWSASRNRGLLEALAVQLPERIGRELPDVAAYAERFDAVSEAFLESLLWRAPGAFSERTRSYINRVIARNQYRFKHFLDVLFTVAGNPDHPYNADFLGRQLRRYTMAERDAWWSTYLFDSYVGEPDEYYPAPQRLLDWAWRPYDKSKISDEAVRLSAVGLAWTLTTSNRFLRDRATKALVMLLQDRFNILVWLLRDFADVDDPYVAERLYAVAYGCAMRRPQVPDLVSLAQTVYDLVFRSVVPLPHVLLRDYARGVIELAIEQGIKLDFEETKIRAPYGSMWDEAAIPDEDAHKAAGAWTKEMPRTEWARMHIYSSLDSMGDFSRYVVGTNSPASFHFGRRRLKDPLHPREVDPIEDFEESLTDRQRRVWNRLVWNRFRSSFDQVMEGSNDEDLNHEDLGDEDFEENLEEQAHSEPESNDAGTVVRDSESLDDTERAISELVRVFGMRKTQRLVQDVWPRLGQARPNPHPEVFDLDAYRRWMFRRIMAMGWTTGRFGDFDDQTERWRNGGRDAHKVERIGKKYQWIAHHEGLARIADNFVFLGDYGDRESGPYDGPWQLGFRRDIDPSCLVKATVGGDPHVPSWWFSERHRWDRDVSAGTWLRAADDLPSIEKLLGVTEPDTAVSWLTLDGLYVWDEPVPPDKERYRFPYRSLTLFVGSYFVRLDDVDTLVRWLERARPRYWDRPRSREIHQVYLGELFWSPAYRHFARFDYSRSDWTRGDRKRLPCEVVVPTAEYNWEGNGFDCSVDDSITIRLPSEWLVHRMDLYSHGEEGQFRNANGGLVAMDPSVISDGPSVLLVRKDSLEAMLQREGLALVWIVHGGKRVMGHWSARDDWPGELILSGAWSLKGGAILGRMLRRFHGGDGWARAPRRGSGA